MIDRKIYTPEGVNDILHNECYIKRKIEKKMRELFRRCGYRELEPPNIEYYDVFSGSNDLIMQETMFKFFDKYGRILVLRPDITISVARITATKFKNYETPIKHFYIGNTFKYDEIGGGKQKEFTQAGIEIIGLSNPQSDAEVISMAINTIKLTGLEKFQIDIGQIDFFYGIMEEAGLDSDQIKIMKNLIDNKNFIGIEKAIEEYNIDNNIKELILDLPKMFGSVDIIEKIKKRTNNKKSMAALKNIEDVLDILDDYGLSNYVSVDLGFVPTDKDFNCYSGIIFKGFTYGIGFPILRGGRYDSLLSCFNDERPATGFALGINFLMMAIERQKIKHEINWTDSLICYDKSGRKTAFLLAEGLRKQDLIIEIDLTGKDINYQKEYARKTNIGGIVYVKDKEKIEVHNLESNEIVNTKISDLLGNSQI